MGRILPFALLGFLYLGLLIGSTPTKQRLVRSSGGTTGLKIAAFNVQIFGKTKMSKEEVEVILVQIIRRYDIILIQEIRDASQEYIYVLLSLVNQQGGPSYSMELSERLGRTKVKEQYAFLYRNESAAVLGSYQYDDGPDDFTDPFEREPFSVKFRSLISGVEFVLCALHAKYSDAVNELNALAEVVTIDIANEWPTDDVLVLGDLNADCTYVRNLTCAALSLRCSPFTWLIPDDADTTVSTTDCAYDRFVALGQNLTDGISNASVFRFDLEYGLTYDEAKAVSDHYPIQLELV